MNSNRNGKLIAGLLIMFVVAVSIVGVTYAYFVAGFNGNQDSLVTITAGKLIAQYKGGTSIEATNIVPGWISDTLHYYDVDVAAANQGRIYATKKTESTTSEYATELYGLERPIEFEVFNNSDSEDIDSSTDGVQSPVSYIIRLKVNANGILQGKANATTSGDTALANAFAEDSKNMLVSLYKGTFNANAENFGGTKISGPFVVGAKDTIHLATPAAETINTVGDSASYFVMFEYINDKCGAQPSKGIQMDVEAQVVGIQKDNTTNDWYDEDNNKVAFESVPEAITYSTATDVDGDLYILKTCTVDGVSVTNDSMLIGTAPAA